MNPYKVIFSSESRQDLIQIYDFIYESSLDVAIAERFVEHLYQSIVSSVSLFPEKHPVYRDDIHKYVHPKHVHYSAFFRVNEQAHRVEILAITNTAQLTRYLDF